MPDLRAGLPSPARGDEVGLPGGLRAPPWRIEKSFRMSKHDLQARPVYHHKRESIEAQFPTAGDFETISKPLSRASKQTTCTRRATPAKMRSVVTSRHECRWATWSLASLAGCYRFSTEEHIGSAASASMFSKAATQSCGPSASTRTFAHDKYYYVTTNAAYCLSRCAAEYFVVL